MGMFDYVNVELKCPYCNEGIVTGVQSKSSDCTLSTLDPQYVTNFYSSCPKCKKWVEYDRKSPGQGEEPRSTPYSREEIGKMGFTLIDRRW